MEIRRECEIRRRREGTGQSHTKIHGGSALWAFECDTTSGEYVCNTFELHRKNLANVCVVDKKLPPKPMSTCPFEREADFVERDVISDVMIRCQPGSRLALIGIGGAGYVLRLSRLMISPRNGTLTLLAYLPLLQ